VKKLWLLCPIAFSCCLRRPRDRSPWFEHWIRLSGSVESRMHATLHLSDHFAVELLADFPNDSAMLFHRESDVRPRVTETFKLPSSSFCNPVGDSADRRYSGHVETVGPHEKRTTLFRVVSGESFPLDLSVRIHPRVASHLLLEVHPNSLFRGQDKRI